MKTSNDEKRERKKEKKRMTVMMKEKENHLCSVLGFVGLVVDLELVALVLKAVHLCNGRLGKASLAKLTKP